MTGVSLPAFAIRAYRRDKPDVVLMDFAMAKLNGLTACRNILSKDPDGCVLFLSGFGERTELTPECSGALAVLQKPVNVARLEQVLQEAGSRRQAGLFASKYLDPTVSR